MKVLKSLVPYLLIAAMMWLLWLCNSNADRLPFVNMDLWMALFYLAPLLLLLMGAVAGRCMGLPGFYPWWRAVLDGALAVLLLLLGYGPLTLRIFGLGRLVLFTETLFEGGMRAPFMLFSGLLLGRLTLLIGRRRGGEAAPEQKEGAAKALKSLVPYLLAAVLMWLLWLSNSNADRLIFMVDGAYLAAFLLTPLLPLLMGVIAGRSARLPAVYPWWRAALDGALALLLFLMGHSGLTIHLFGPFGKLGAIAASAAKGGLRVPLVVFAGLLLGRLTLLIGRRRAKEAVSE